ncbi:MAG: hypothetical protein ACM3NT_09235 [Methylocystaceae bacterium]
MTHLIDSNKNLSAKDPKLKHKENMGLDGNRNPEEDVDTITLPHPVNIYPHETKTKWDGP